ncbi:hypothetical protein [Streptomyces sp. cg40]|uniref:hypothetical protein n=1 Tax=Streptomyces sp. cg40 TaxID=3419764 RepID=UPI003D00656E
MDGLSRLWRRVLVAWAVAVVGGGGLTWWLQDSGGPHEPYSWQLNNSDGETPTPSPSQDGQDGQDAANGCPTPTSSPYDDPHTIFICLKNG